MIHGLTGALAAVYLRLVGRTSTVVVQGAGGPDALRSRRIGWVYAFWHRVQIPLALTHVGQGIVGLASLSRDGEYIASTLARLGYGTVRGSTSRGGAAALGELVDLLKAGRVVAVTPDGPRGPAGVVQPGALAAARLAGVPVVTVGCAASRAHIFNSWDRFVWPWPGGRIAVVYGEPFTVEDDARGAERLSATLRSLTETAERLAVTGEER